MIDVMTAKLMMMKVTVIIEDIFGAPSWVSSRRLYVRTYTTALSVKAYHTCSKVSYFFTVP